MVLFGVTAPTVLVERRTPRLLMINNVDVRRLTRYLARYRSLLRDTSDRLRCSFLQNGGQQYRALMQYVRFHLATATTAAARSLRLPIEA